MTPNNTFERIGKQHAVSIAAIAVGVLITAQGILGLAMPDAFVALVGEFQRPAMLYVAAAVRVAIGVVLVLAASRSRVAWPLRVLGSLITIGGLLTPIIGVPFAQSVLAWWAEGGATVVRAWATAALVIGCFILYATLPKRAA